MTEKRKTYKGTFGDKHGKDVYYVVEDKGNAPVYDHGSPNKKPPKYLPKGG